MCSKFSFFPLFIALILALRLAASAQTLIPIIETGDPSERLNLVVLSEAYTAAELTTKFVSDGSAVIEDFLSRQPFAAYRDRFNAYLIAVASNESGADDPSEGIVRDTYFNSTFDSFGIDRLLTIDSTGSTRAYSLLANLLPGYDIPLVLVNDPQYGGAGGALSVASTNSAASEIAIHEIGHSFGGLADEYTYNAESYSPYETINATAVTDRELIRWKHWIDLLTPVPTPDTSAWDGTVGLFEGAIYRSAGWYRPTRNSLMRNLNREFDAVNEEQLALRIYDRLHPIFGTSPATGSIAVSEPEALMFQLDLPPLPIGGGSGVSWYLDGQNTAGEESETDLVPAGSSWKYLDSGNFQAGWQQPGFNDTAWQQGPAQLGYGDGDEATLIGFGGNASSRAVTSWFRHRFVVDDPAGFARLHLELLRDDGAVVYLNGVEVYRDQMASGAVAASTLAASSAGGSDEDRFFDAMLDPGALVAGENVIAVEVHQSDVTSSDVSFDLELRGVSESASTGDILPAGAQWRYDDSGTAPAANWAEAGFDDSGWPTGVAELGFGDSDEATIVTAGALTYRFRTVFDITEPGVFEQFDGFLRRDDGAIVFINGTEVFRSNLPAGRLTATTLASATADDDGNGIIPFQIPAGVIVAGENLVAVQVHQRSATSSDVSFELRIAGKKSAGDFVLDPVQLSAGSHVLEARVSDPTGKIRQDPDNLAREIVRWDITVLDSDNDTLPDVWENYYFHNLSQSETSDSDGDGQPNANEYIAGTDPSDSASSFNVVSFLREEDGSGFLLTWSSLPGRRYQIMRTDDLADGSWEALGEVLATDPVSSFLVPVDEASEAAFYRIEVMP